MALLVQSKTIGEYSYAVTQLDAVKGRRVFARLLKVAAPALASLSGGSKVKPDDLAKGLAALAETLSEDDVDFFCDAFAPSTTVTLADGKAPRLSDIFAVHFAGKYLELVKWLAFALEVNFGPFWRGLSAKAGDSPPPASA